jgi:hypothetical protein
VVLEGQRLGPVERAEGVGTHEEVVVRHHVAVTSS